MKKTIIVTGGTQGIGLAVAKKFLSKDYNVVVCSSNEAKGLKAIKLLKPLGEVTYVKCNVADNDDCVNVAKIAQEKYGRIDALVNVAGILSKRNHFLECDLNDVRKTLNINVMGTIQMSLAVSKYMAHQREGTIINISSICGSLANTESVGYHASKGAVNMITKSIASELSAYGIRVVAVAPGWVHTEMIDDSVAEIGASLHLKGRIIEPEEIANAVFLMSLPEASAINGSTVMTDDGYSSFKGFEGASRLL